MSLNAYLALLVYAFVTSITPGPNNLMLLMSGVNFGIVRTVPHMLGISIGFLVLLLAVGFGIGAVLTAVPAPHTALKTAGAACLLYLAWKIAMSRTRSGGAADALHRRRRVPMGQSKGVGDGDHCHGRLHHSGPPLRLGALISIAFTIVNLPSVSVSAGFGTMLRGFLSDPMRPKWFNIAMSLLLAATLWPMMR